MKNKKPIVKKLAIGILGVIIAIQFIRPSQNENNKLSNKLSPNDITQTMAVPNEVGSILKRSCYDCHSNHTVYPWYVNIQPIGFWLEHHVKEGKAELNFSEWASYTKKKQDHKLEEMVEMIEDGEMPLSSYTLVHKDAVLSETEKTLVIDFVKTLIPAKSADSENHSHSEAH